MNNNPLSKMHLNEFLQRLYDEGVRDFSNIILRGGDMTLGRHDAEIYLRHDLSYAQRPIFSLGPISNWALGSGTMEITGYGRSVLTPMVVHLGAYRSEGW